MGHISNSRGIEPDFPHLNPSNDVSWPYKRVLRCPAHHILANSRAFGRPWTPTCRRPGAPGTGPGNGGATRPAPAEVRIHQLPGIHGLHAAPRGGDFSTTHEINEIPVFMDVNGLAEYNNHCHILTLLNMFRRLMCLGERMNWMKRV